MVARLSKLGVTPDIAKRLRRIGKATRAQLDTMLTVDTFPRSKAWVAQCYNPPGTSELRMSMLDDALGTHGVEVLGQSDDWREGPFATYCNTGDTYDCTIVRYRSGTYALTSWGNVAEANPRTIR